jgi:cell division protein FtsW (lipid II flippase)
LGIVPAISSVGLIVPFSFKAFEALNIYKDQRWSWTFAYYTGILLVIWINVQLSIIRHWDYLHLIYSLLGLAIIICVQLPSLRKYYKKNWLGLTNE